jgi:hypothetical protein
MRKLNYLPMLLGALPLTAMACGGGGGDSVAGGAIEGLTLPDNMGLVDVDESTANGSVTAGASGNVTAPFAASSDYETDEVNAHMWDEATESLDIINEILTAVSQTRADHFVNTGAYMALVEVIGDDGDQSADTGQSTGGNATELEPWTILSTRASATAAQIVQFWISQEEDFGAGSPITSTIYGKATVSEEPSATKPYGDFSMNFAMVNNADDIMFQRGRLTTVPVTNGELGFTFMMEDVIGMFGEDTAVAVRTNAAQTAGRAHMSVPDYEGGGTKTFTMAYNQDYFLRSDGVDTKLLDRNSLSRNIWGYNLYHAADGNGFSAGDRVDLQGGFPFVYGTVGAREFGWCDYWGIWTSDPESLDNGDTVTRDEDGNEATYTVLKAPGKLVRVTKRSIALADLDGENFEYWDWESGNQYLVTYTHGTTTWTNVAQRDQETWEWVDLETPTTMTITDDWWYGFWSMSFGGNVDFIGGQTGVTVREQAFVSSDDSIFSGGTSLTLHSMQESLRAGINQTQANTGDIYMDEVANPANAYEYTFQKDGRVLQYGGTDVGLATGIVPVNSPYEWGMHSGPMTSVDPVTLGITDPWEMWNQDTYYFYETGHNEWNQYATLIQSNNTPVEFDDPINFFYTHSTANDADNSAEFDGKKVFLTYGGDRNLWGIPGREVDMDGDGNGDRWYPMFSIADGVVMGPNGDEYVIKAVDMELFMDVSADAIPGALATALTEAGSLALPTMTAWTDPTTTAQPLINEDPKVVAGVIQ